MSPPIGSHKGQGKRSASQSVKESTRHVMMAKQGGIVTPLPLYSVDEALRVAGLK